MTRPPLPPYAGPVKPVRRRVTGLTSAPLDGDPTRYRWTVLLRPESGNGDADTLYVEAPAGLPPFTSGQVIDINPLLLADKENP